MGIFGDIDMLSTWWLNLWGLLSGWVHGIYWGIAGLDTQIVTAIISTLGALGGTWLGAYLNSRSSEQTALQLAEVERHKYKHDRLWDARKEAYTLIIAELNDLERVAGRIYSRFYGDNAQPEGYFQSEVYDTDTAELWTLFHEVKALGRSNRLILADEFVERISHWERDFIYDEKESPTERVICYRNAMAKHLPEFIEFAKREIAPA
ncbi:hypothetical protein BH10PLA2_BH10PLA2_00290 [soil metagenome]